MPPTAHRRLAAQSLIGVPFASAPAVVARLGAVQAQDCAGARWAVGMRVHGATDASVEQACDAGAIVRTHVLRPTWHFVAAEDLRWMLALSGPRVQALNAGRYRQLGLDDATLRVGRAALADALRDGTACTRAELATAVARAGISLADPQRMAYLLMHAELAAMLCSGPRRGKQHTYVLVDARVPAARVPAAAPRDRDDALRELATRYFATRGPATAQDFAWWSGLTVADARRGAALAAPDVVREEIDGREHWGPADAPPVAVCEPRAHLLPNYDEYFIGFRDRGAILQAVARDALPVDRGEVLSAHIVVLDGQVVAGWRRVPRARAISAVVTPVVPLGPGDRDAIARAAARYAAFLGAPVALEWTTA
ncbi:MAG: winged helix DNA-binding domain-containing protein [Gemmatirosa sp.]